MADKLTIKQEKFAQGLFAGLSQREAYKQAYNCKNWTDKSIDEKACTLAKDVKIMSRLGKLTEELKQRNMVTVEKVLSELAKVGFANGSDFARVIEKEWTEEITDEEGNKTEKVHKYKAVDVIPTELLEKEKLAAIAGIKATEKGIEVKTNDKLKALELMGKYLGMFTDKVEMTGKDGGPIEIKGMNEEEIDQQIKEMQDKLGITCKK